MLEKVASLGLKVDLRKTIDENEFVAPNVPLIVSDYAYVVQCSSLI
jgi:hypothetical protein